MKPGRSISPRLGHRVLVVATAAVWLVFISPYPQSLDGAGMPLTLLLLGLDLVMCIGTAWLAWKRSQSIDERQVALRDRSYRIAFRLILLGVLVMIVAIFIGSMIASSNPDWVAVQTPVVLGGRWIVGFLELLAATPTAVIAWLQPGLFEEVASERTRGWLTQHWVPLAAVPILAALWLLSLSALPVRANTVRDDAQHSLTVAGASCGHFTGGREAGYGFGAQVSLDVEVCWDGKHAYAFRQDPTADLTRCEVSPGTADFARITHLRCTERTDASGTMFYTVRATVAPVLGSGLSRDVVVELDVTRDGKVLTFG